MSVCHSKKKLWTKMQMSLFVTPRWLNALLILSGF